MGNIETKLDEVVALLTKSSTEKSNVGLLNGKLGMSIFFFELAKATQDEAYLTIAETQVEEVYKFLGEGIVPADFENGLAGIALGIIYLAKNGFVEADLEEILMDLDDRIFKHLTTTLDDMPFNLKQGLLGYLFYVLCRYEIGKDSGDDANKYIFRRLGADLINRLAQFVEEEKFQTRDPILFTLFWDLPVLLILLTKARRLNINSGKVDRILDYLSPVVLSLLPRLHSNRLHLLLGLEYLLKEMDIHGWREHADFLRASIDTNRIIDDECKNLNILVLDGISGLDIIGRILARATGDKRLQLSGPQVYEKISRSVYWGELDFYKKFKNSIGLASGLSGIGMLLLEFLKGDGNQRVVDNDLQHCNEDVRPEGLI